MEESIFSVVVVGGGMAGLCAAIASARQGARTALVHNRPVLGGNASSEIRMHICGASAHRTRPNARETGIIEEILLENKHRNPTHSYPIFDSILWEKAAYEKNLSLFLNTHAIGVRMSGKRIESVDAIGLTNERRFRLKADMFMDATGDGTIGAMAGADFVIGREPKEAYGESLAPDEPDSFTMGSSLMFQARDMGHPVPFIKPFWARSYTEEDLRLRDHSSAKSGYWWVELGGGKQKIIEDAESIRNSLLEAVFGVWDHIKNGGDHGAQNYDLEWVGFLPGKRESRRFLGDYVLTQNDCLSGARFKDDVSYGGWPIDVHNNEGFLGFSQDPTDQVLVQEIYGIPYRCLYSRNIENLFLGGRIISCSRIAFSSTRVMSTCAAAGQAAGTAAAFASRLGVSPRELLPEMDALQQQLLRDGCFIPGVKNEDPLDLAREAKVAASGFEDGWEPENIINGVARPVGSESNGWRALYSSMPWISFDFETPVRLSEIRFTFDSNLNREVTISIIEDVLDQQHPSTPPELVMDFKIDLFLGKEHVFSIAEKGNHQRLRSVSFDPVVCDKAVITFLEGNGSPHATVFEIRMHE